MHSKYVALIVLGTAALVAAIAAWPERPQAPAATPAPRWELPQPTVDLQAVRKQAMERAEDSLDWADRELGRALDEQLRPLDRFFIESQQRSGRFAEAALSFGSKWRYVADKAPFTRGDRHAEFLKAAFAQHLFSEQDLTRAIEQVVRGYSDAVEAVENQMLVKIREDLSDLPAAALPGFTDSQTLNAAYNVAIRRALDHVGSEVRADLTTLMVSLAAQEVLTQVAVKLGVSAGILSAGAGSSWATFGVGMVVGLIVDQLVTWVWDWWADPLGSLEKDLNAKLDELRKMLIEGDESTPGLRARLTEFGKQRSAVRRQAVQELIQPLDGTLEGGFKSRAP